VSRRIVHLTLIALHALFALAVVYVPLSTVLRSFGETQLASDGVEAIGLARWPMLLLNTLIVTGVATLIAVGIGLPVGVLVGRSDLPGRRLVRGLAGFLACLPPVVYAALAIAVVPLWKLPPSAWLCGVGYGFVFLPLAIVVCGGLARGVPTELEDVALLEADAGRVLWYVTARHCLPGAAALGLLFITIAATDMAITDLMRVRTFAEEVYTQYALRRAGVGPILTGLPVLVVTAVLLTVFFGRSGWFADGSIAAEEAVGRALRPARGVRIVAFVLLAACAAGLAWPTVKLVMQTETVSAARRSAENLVGDIGRSLLVTAPAAALMATAAVGLAHAIVRGRFARRLGIIGLALLLAVPAPTTGIALADILNHPDWRGAIYDSPVALIIGYIVRYLPVAVVLLAAAIQRIPAAFEQMGRLDGADWPALLRHIVWPLTARDAAVAALVCLILAFAEIGTSVLIAPPGYSIASVRIFGLLHGGVYRDVAVLAILSSACMIGPWAGLAWLFSRSRIS
jgi:iron(III) transport system permease protein